MIKKKKFALLDKLGQRVLGHTENFAARNTNIAWAYEKTESSKLLYMAIKSPFGLPPCKSLFLFYQSFIPIKKRDTEFSCSVENLGNLEYF